MVILVWIVGVLGALAGELEFGYSPSLGPGEQPMLSVTVPRAAASLWVQVEAGEQVVEFNRSSLAPGELVELNWTRNTAVLEALATIRVEFEDGYVEAVKVPVSYVYAGRLEVDLSGASADLENRTITVSVNQSVDHAEIKAIGAHKRVFDERTIQLGEGPGDISIPWTGDPSEVVLLDVTLHAGNAWSGFTYSPWFVNIPHDDVVFGSGSSDVDVDQVQKLQDLLAEVHGLVQKYGEVVPVKLYIGGCTDTVGSREGNARLSRERARSIGAWLRTSGLDIPVFFHGFGEGWLAVPTADGVDNVLNRRAVYMVGANPPPASAGVPRGRWSAL
jgi:outer membrane protein OmpA-like peptidoglycan-associated protein